MTKVLLVDFMYLWNKLYYVFQDEQYDKLMTIMEKLHNSSFYVKKVVVLDGYNGTSKHKELLPTYKEGRSNKTKVYSRVDEFVREASLKYPSILFVRGDNYEADQVIANFIPFYNKHASIFIYSGDKDLIQLLVHKNTYIGDKYHGGLEVVPYTLEEALKKFEKVTGGRLKSIEDLVKFRAFRGDPSDNIPAAIPRLASAKIFDIIENCWKTTSLNKETMLSYTEGTNLYSKMLEGIGNLQRNWELMYLDTSHYKEVLREIKRLKVCT